VLAGALAVAVVTAAGLTWGTAWATFTVSSPTYSTTWSTGTVVLADDDAGRAMFTVSGLAPGAAGTRCLTVTSTGSVPALVHLYVTGRSTTKSLASALTVAVVAGSGGGTGNCAGFVPATIVYRGSLAAFPTSWSTGVDAWTTTGSTAGETRSYQITWSVPATASTGAQGGTAAAAFTWEAQNR
jgi:hypothetical protein